MTVEEEQSLITVEGDKASMEVPAFRWYLKNKSKVGDKVSTGSLIMVFEVAGQLLRPVAQAPAAAPALLLHQHQHLLPSKSFVENGGILASQFSVA